MVVICSNIHVCTGSVAMVTGSYSYHHYMQDGFNDTVSSGCGYVMWLCGYRDGDVPTDLCRPCGPGSSTRATPSDPYPITGTCRLP